MDNIYIAVYVCKSKESIGVPGYHSVRLGLRGAKVSSDIIIGETCSNFVVGQEYVITISNMSRRLL